MITSRLFRQSQRDSSLLSLNTILTGMKMSKSWLYNTFIEEPSYKQSIFENWQVLLKSSAENENLVASEQRTLKELVVSLFFSDWNDNGMGGRRKLITETCTAESRGDTRRASYLGSWQLNGVGLSPGPGEFITAVLEH